MIVDATRLRDGRLEAKICIIGSGMGGASVAKKLIEAGLDVLFVEAGASTPRSGEPPVQHQIVGRDFGVPTTRALEVGGGTNLWHGICARFDPIDFEARRWIAHSGWPIGARDLEPYYDEALEWLGVGAAPKEGVAPNVTDQDVLVSKAFWTCRRPARMKDAVLRWTRAGQARCVVNAVALRLDTDAAGAVRSLVVGRRDGTIEVRAEVFIIAAGALETPRLLLNSARTAAGPFRASAAHVGRYLMDHPVGYFSQLVFHAPQAAAFGPPVTDLRQLAGFALAPELQRRFGFPNHYVFVRPGVSAAKAPNELLRNLLAVRGIRALSPRRLLPALSSPYVLQRILRERLGLGSTSRYGDIYVMAEQVPNPASRVTLSSTKRDRHGMPIAQVDWRLSATEWSHFGAYFGKVVQGLRADPRVASVRVDPESEWPQVLSSAAHHLGTARMAATPRRGVVDANLRVFGFANLFISDGSVFPTAGGTNPSLTICALALRLGDYLTRIMTAPVRAGTKALREGGRALPARPA